MSKIEVGEYCRSKYGEIGIVTKIYPQLMWRKKKNPSLLDFNEIKTHSKNITDLIEIGDILKVHIFADKNDEDSEDIETTWRIESEYERPEIKEFIKENYGELLSILTHEQYEQNSYKVGDIE